MSEEKAHTVTAAPQLTLEEVRDRFEAWRKTRKRCRPIPSELWDAAVGLAKAHSINKVSKALHLNYTALKNHIRGPIHRLPARKFPSAFIELDFSKQVFASHWVVEMEKPSGAKMKISFSGNTGVDPLAFSKAFWDNGV